MMFRHYKPLPPLRHLVSRIMVSRFSLDATDACPVIPFPPQPEHCLYFYPYDSVTCRNYASGTTEVMPSSMLVGPQLSRVDLTMGRNMLVIMIGFHPGGMHRLLRIPMHELLDQPLDTTLLFGSEVEDITNQLRHSGDPDRMVEIIQGYLLKKATGLKRSLPVEEALLCMLQQKTMVQVDELARQACVSTRQLERQFKERVGMPPKLYSRMVRFSNAWMMRERSPNLSWLQIAHSCAYADQMHMIRDFKDFAGVTPGVLQSDLEKSTLRLQGPTFD